MTGLHIDAVVLPGATAERTLTWLGLSSTPDLSADGSHVLFTER